MPFGKDKISEYTTFPAVPNNHSVSPSLQSTTHVPYKHITTTTTATVSSPLMRNMGRVYKGKEEEKGGRG
jgi:hypothetical protein